MQGSSPFANGFQSPSFHSSSYLPKLEANFMKDFTCCNLILPSLHDLLQHFEEAHAQQIAPMNGQYPLAGGISDGMNGLPRTGVSTQQQNQQNISSGVNQQQAANRLPTNTQMQSMQAPQMGNNPQSNMHSQPSQDMEAVEDMEMDDVPGDYSSGVTGYAIPETQPYGQRSQYGQTNTTRVPPLDLNTMNINNPLQSFQGIRQSQPSTPVSSGRQGALFGNNPTVSSVNTPTLSAHPLQHQFRNTPDSSTPGTPAELDPDFVGNLGGMTMDGQGFMMSQPQANSGFGFQNGNDLLDFCIDEPAKRLFSPNGAFASNQGQSRLGNAQYGANSEIARRIREQQCKVGLSDTVNVPNGEEPKPFRCPVIGCEKAYKNQNGLKYHKSVSSAA